MTSKENNYSFTHAPCLSPFKLSLSHHLLTWNGINLFYFSILPHNFTTPQLVGQ
ncbi:hypothetical protein GCHA_4366 [Paraglaciecola chathamensis S18K6]|uniref:Uncharacterized protein n=1 Tax=Paraglaciecola chathamensis S18K6 TaxID=1127672 RepID=A0AAV3V6H1_9ALTE|nr:hypothetical protein GCHA_4366 [Paraglaciecola chathamensis S18K6]